MPFAGINKLTQGDTWYLTGLPDGAAVTVMTLSKGAKISEVDVLTSDATGTVSHTVWQKASRMHFRIAAAKGTGIPAPTGTYALHAGSPTSAALVDAPAEYDVSFIADTKP